MQQLLFVCECFVTKIRFHGEELLAPRPTSMLEDHPLSTVQGSSFNTFAATLYIGSHSWEDNIKMDLHEVGCGGMDWVRLAQDRLLVGTCECSNEASGSIKCRKFLD
jgi:hypothetical protein